VKSIIDRLLSKPEWQNPDPAARAEAVLRLPSSEAETLRAIAQDDTEPRVRRAAARKLADIEALTDLARSDGDEGVREEASSRLAHLAAHATEETSARAALGALSDPRHLAAVVLSAARPEVRETALGTLDDPRTLATVVREAEDPGLRLAALGRIDDEATLLALALKSDQKAVAVAAVDRIEGAESLQVVADGARAGAAARRARARLDRAQGPETSGPAETPSTAEDDAREREAYEKARAEQEREAKERAEAISAREALCVSVESAEGEAIPEALEEARAKWPELAPLSGSDASALATRFEAALAGAKTRQATYAAGLARREELAGLVSEAESLAEAEESGDTRAAWKALETKWTALAVSADQPDLRERYEAARGKHRDRRRASREEREKKDRENLARLEKLAGRAEALVEKADAELRQVDHVSRDIKTALDRPGHFPTREDRERVLARLEAARKALYPRLQDLREDAEWKRWANVTVQEDLCQRTEALAEEEDLDAVAKKLRDIDAGWKQAKEAPKEKAEALWTRFKTARDAVRERLDAHFARQAEEWAENLKKKEALCEKAEALGDSTEWTKTADALRALQAEWKTIGQVPRAQSRRIWERFRKPCDQFFTRWQEHRGQRDKEWGENLKKKEALCEKAESLQDSTDWDSTANELKRLQTEWRGIGAVKKSRSEAVWRRFRKACDHFFDRYKHRDSLALEAVRTARETLCAELEALAPAEGTEAAAPDDLVARVQAAQTAWRQAGELPRDMMAPLESRFSVACEELVKAFPEAFSGTELDPEASRKKAEKLASRVEAVLEELNPQGGAETIETTEELAARLRDALAANTIGGKEAEEARWHSATSDVEAAQAAWRRLGPMPGEEGQALVERFESACKRFFEQRPRPEPRPAEKPRPRKRRPRRHD
jgi:hypothetical protein